MYHGTWFPGRAVRTFPILFIHASRYFPEGGWRHPVRADYSSSSLYLWYYPVPLVMIRQA